MRRLLILAFGIGLGAVPVVVADAADARALRRSSGSVTACSQHGHFDCYTARVVRSPVGRKLVLEHGTVIDCGPDCRDTLRRETVDFWDTLRENGS